MSDLANTPARSPKLYGKTTLTSESVPVAPRGVNGSLPKTHQTRQRAGSQGHNARRRTNNDILARSIIIYWLQLWPASNSPSQSGCGKPMVIFHAILTAFEIQVQVSFIGASRIPGSWQDSYVVGNHSPAQCGLHTGY